MQTRANTYSAPIVGPRLDIGPSSLKPQASGLVRSAFTLIEILVVVAIMALAMGAILPSLKGFFEGARIPDASNLISANLIAARNYAVANNITTALVFTEDTSATKRRVQMYLARHDPILPGSPNRFTVVPGKGTTYLPDNVLVSDDITKDSQGNEDTVVICFSSAGQLTADKTVDVDTPPISTIGLLPSQATFYLYDDSVSDDPRDFRINYYTGTVIEQ